MIKKFFNLFSKKKNTAADFDFAFADVMTIVKAAGDKTQELQGHVVAIDKEDGSPVSIADRKSSRIVIEGLRKLTPDIPVISEEASKEDNAKAAKSRLHWVVDPLDGTRTYLDGHEGYGCHLALMDGDTPVLGFAYFPSADPDKQEFYYTAEDGKAYLKTGSGDPVRLQVSKPSAKETKLTAATGWKDKTLSLDGTELDLKRAVGGGRLCVTAAGKTDIAVFNGWFSDWDLAAAHAIIKAAGGDLLNMETGKPITYSDKNYAVPPSLGGHPEVVKRLLDQGFHAAARSKPYGGAYKKRHNK
jgi:3'(2'), 5'-bisphosphate nucleotidase